MRDKVDLNKCIEIIDQHISSVKSCLPSDISKIDKLRDIRVKISNLIRSLFSDSNERLKDFEESMDTAQSREAPKKYDEQAKVMIRYLSAIKDELYLRIESNVKDEKLITLKKEVEEKGIESERREKVVESKFYGAAIEIIDRLRNELKDKTQLREDIISIKRDISEIKEILDSLLKREGSLGGKFGKPTE